MAIANQLTMFIQTAKQTNKKQELVEKTANANVLYLIMMVKNLAKNELHQTNAT